MDLHYLKLFDTVASLGSMTKASEHMHISQPALSIQIKKLEDGLGLKLFNKIGTRLILNENGEILFHYTKQIFQLVQEASNQLTDRKLTISGQITIGGSNTAGSYLLPRIIGAFKQLYPQVTIELHIGNTYEIANLIYNDVLDFAINGGDVAYTSQTQVIPLKEDPLVLVASPKSDYIEQHPLLPEDLEAATFIVHQNNSQLYLAYKKAITELHLEENIAMTLGSIDAIKQAVAADLGLAFIPYSAALMELQLGLLIQLEVKNMHWVYPYNLIYNKSKFLSPATLRLIEMVKEHLGQT